MTSGDGFIGFLGFDAVRRRRTWSNEDQAVLRFVGQIFTQAIERRRAEEALVENERRLALAIKGTNAGWWDWQVQTGELMLDMRWAEMVGYTLDELKPISIRTWFDFCHPGDLQESGRLLEKHFSGQTDYYESAARMRHKDGSWIWVLDRGKVVTWDQDGRPVRMIGTHMDITEHRLQESERQSLQERLHQVEKAESLSRMAGAVAHHFNNMLAATIANLELAALDLPLGTNLPQNISRAKASALRAAEMSTLMLTLLGQSQGRPELLDLSAVCMQNLSHLRSSIPDWVNVETNLPAPGPPVKADPVQIGQVAQKFFHQCRRGRKRAGGKGDGIGGHGQGVGNRAEVTLSCGLEPEVKSICFSGYHRRRLRHRCKGCRPDIRSVLY